MKGGAAALLRADRAAQRAAQQAELRAVLGWLKPVSADLDALAQLARDASERSRFSDHHRTARHAGSASSSCSRRRPTTAPPPRPTRRGRAGDRIAARRYGRRRAARAPEGEWLRRQLRQSRARRSSRKRSSRRRVNFPALADGGGPPRRRGVRRGPGGAAAARGRALEEQWSAAAWGTQFRAFVHELEGLLREMDVPKDGVSQVRATVQRVLDDRDEYNGGTKPAGRENCGVARARRRARAESVEGHLLLHVPIHQGTTHLPRSRSRSRHAHTTLVHDRARRATSWRTASLSSSSSSSTTIGFRPRRPRCRAGGGSGKDVVALIGMLHSDAASQRWGCVEAAAYAVRGSVALGVGCQLGGACQREHLQLRCV